MVAPPPDRRRCCRRRCGRAARADPSTTILRLRARALSAQPLLLFPFLTSLTPPLRLPSFQIIMSGMQGTKRATEYDPSSTSASSSSSGCRAPHGSGSGGGACGARGDGGGDGGGGLYELPHDPVRMVFDFLDGPADILRVATLSRSAVAEVGSVWRELVCTDSMWRDRFEREGLAVRARLFEVALPAVQRGGGGGVGGGSSTVTKEDELAGVGLAFYKQVFALKVENGAGSSIQRALRPS